MPPPHDSPSPHQYQSPFITPRTTHHSITKNNFLTIFQPHYCPSLLTLIASHNLRHHSLSPSPSLRIANSHPITTPQHPSPITNNRTLASFDHPSFPITPHHSHHYPSSATLPMIPQRTHIPITHHCQVPPRPYHHHYKQHSITLSSLSPITTTHLLPSVSLTS